MERKMKENLISEIDNFKKRNIWVTRKARINSEARYLNYNSHSYFMLNWLSMWSLIFSITTLVINSNVLNYFSIFFSVLMLGSSLIVTGFKFEESANDYKHSYIKIAELENKLEHFIKLLKKEVSNEDDIMDEFLLLKQDYQYILNNTPNHSYLDYLKVSIDRNNEIFPVSVFEILNYYSYSFVYNLILFFLVLMPIIIIIIELVRA